VTSGWNWRFLRKPRWLIGTVVLLAAAFVMINLGLWQLRRLHQRLERNSAIEARMNAPAVPLARALARFDFTVPLGAADSAAYRHVEATGRYVPADEVLLRSRSLGGHPGFHVLTPLELPGGRALLVDRGWVPYTDNDPPLPDAAPPAGEVNVSGLLRDPDPLPRGEFTWLSPSDPVSGPLRKTFYANPQRLQPQMPFPLVGGYLQLVTQSPAQPGELPVAPGAPDLSNGPHLSYAIQWFSFSAIALVGYGAVFVRRARDPESDADADREAEERRRREAAAGAGDDPRGDGGGAVPSGD